MMMFDMAKMMKQAKKMQDKMMEIQDELAGTTIVGKSSCGKVQISCTGKFEEWNVTGLEGVEPAEANAKVQEALEDLTKQIMEQTQSRMGELTKGLNIPGLKLPGM
jgi:nucleoid-associated protein EbfC